MNKLLQEMFHEPESKGPPGHFPTVGKPEEKPLQTPLDFDFCFFFFSYLKFRFLASCGDEKLSTALHLSAEIFCERNEMEQPLRLIAPF